MNVQRLLLALLAWGTVALFVGLGQWQLQRAQFKQSVAAGMQQALQAPEQSLQALLARVASARQPAAALHLPARVRAAGGRYADLPPVLLDNQVRAGRNGVSVHRVFLPGTQGVDINVGATGATGAAGTQGSPAAGTAARDGPAAVLVDMGWLPWLPARALPPLPAPGPGQLPHGLLLPWPGQALALGQPPQRRPGRQPWLLARLERTHLEQELGVQLFDGVLRLDASADHGFDRSQAAAGSGGMTPDKHRGYALQWFSLAAAVAVVYLLLAWRTRRRPRPR